MFAKGVIVELLLIMANVNNQNNITTALIESLCIFAIFKKKMLLKVCISSGFIWKIEVFHVRN